MSTKFMNIRIEAALLNTVLHLSVNKYDILIDTYSILYSILALLSRDDT